MPRLSDELGVKLYIKRDDLTKSIGSGNKIRKMDTCSMTRFKEKRIPWSVVAEFSPITAGRLPGHRPKRGFPVFWPCGVKNPRKLKAIFCGQDTGGGYALFFDSGFQRYFGLLKKR